MASDLFRGTNANGNQILVMRLGAKMSKQNRPLPTNAELEILHVLLELGACNVRQVLAAMRQNRQTDVGYTTALEMLQVMTEKGLVGRDATQRPQLYRAQLPKEQTQRLLLSDLLQKGFGGSAKHLIMQALATRGPSEEELAQVEKLQIGRASCRERV